MELLQYTDTLPETMGSGTRAVQCCTAQGQWVVELLVYIASMHASLLGSNGQWISCRALPHCRGAVCG